MAVSSVENGPLILEVRAVPPFSKNGFIVGSEETGEVVIIDPGDEVDQLIDLVHRRRLSVSHILLTHAHVDHVTGVARAKQAFKVPIYLHKDDEFLYTAAPEQAAFFGFQADRPPPVDRFYAPGEVFAIGEYELSVHETPGHCPGGVCLAAGTKAGPKEDLFVGDTLFAGSIGRTDLPGADYATLMRSIKEVLFAFPDAARVHPGHGPSTTIAAERRSNPFLR